MLINSCEVELLIRLLVFILMRDKKLNVEEMGVFRLWLIVYLKVFNLLILLVSILLANLRFLVLIFSFFWRIFVIFFFWLNLSLSRMANV